MPEAIPGLDVSWPLEGWPPFKVWEHAGVLVAFSPNPMDGLNGYVHVPKDSVWRNVPDYSSLPFDAPGGLTFGPEPRSEPLGPLRGRPARTWEDVCGWVGFDTAHAGDWWSDEELELIEQTYGHQRNQAQREKLERHRALVDRMRADGLDLREHYHQRWCVHWTIDLMTKALKDLAEQVAWKPLRERHGLDG